MTVEANVYFKGGKSNGRLATINVARFAIGMRVLADDEVYVIQDGPIARVIQEMQTGIPAGAAIAVIEVEPTNPQPDAG